MKNQKINLFTIGFTKKTAELFFETLNQFNIKTIIDTRLNNISQLAGFSKKKDLEYFLKKICDIDYIHTIDLAPSQEILHDYKKKKIDWLTYENEYLALIKKRKIEKKLSPQLLNNSCFLCSESKPHHCHRRLAAEYLQKQWGNLDIHHL